MDAHASLFLLFCLHAGTAWEMDSSDDVYYSGKSSPRLEIGEWGQCSVSCGQGWRSRVVECVHDSFFRGRDVRPLHECVGYESVEGTSACTEAQCAQMEEAPHSAPTLFYWKLADFGQCNVTCGEGVQETQLMCVHAGSESAVAWTFCSSNTRPTPKTRVCRMGACAAVWRTGKWKECEGCSSSTHRTVQCVRESATVGGANTRMLVNSSECAGKKPKERRSCKSTCKGWSVGEWSVCSCEKSIRTRSVKCPKGVDCPLPQPPHTQDCTPTACSSPTLRPLTLPLSSVAAVEEGTSLKVKCGKKGREVHWTKDGERVGTWRHHHSGGSNAWVAENGNLRIRDVRVKDGGVFSCFSGSTLLGNVTVRVKDPRQTAAAVEEPSFSFDTSEWGHCVQESCQLNGTMRRDVKCVRGGKGEERVVEWSACSGLTPPPTHMPCWRKTCNRWNVSSWSQCSSTQCVGVGKAEMSREVRCIDWEGRALAESECSLSIRPPNKQLCNHEECIGEWSTSEWSSCSATCGTGGVRMRVVKCVWREGGRAAGRACLHLKQPSTHTFCSSNEALPPCLPNHNTLSRGCVDTLRHCDIINIFHKCDEHIRSKCCASCARQESKMSNSVRAHFYHSD